ncbi:unnamed protein product [Amoebophrya sp. A120]|nr:unnamed protein product [Amoebophrya sp. A120]|eukprot:GSA120T00007622001.1
MTSSTSHLSASAEKSDARSPRHAAAEQSRGFSCRSLQLMFLGSAALFDFYESGNFFRLDGRGRAAATFTSFPMAAAAMPPSKTTSAVAAKTRTNNLRPRRERDRRLSDGNVVADTTAANSPGPRATNDKNEQEDETTARSAKNKWQRNKDLRTTSAPAPDARISTLQLPFFSWFFRGGYGGKNEKDYFNCPSSPAWVHAKCQLEVPKIQESCDQVEKEILGRVSGENGWTDPHNNGNYKLLEKPSNTKPDSGDRQAETIRQIKLQRTTGNGRYTDKLTFTLVDVESKKIDRQTLYGASCAVYGCSESQVTSVLDFSTNFCNLRNLLCGKDVSCPVASQSFNIDWAGLDYGSCSQHQDANCINAGDVEDGSAAGGRENASSGADIKSTTSSSTASKAEVGTTGGGAAAADSGTTKELKNVVDQDNKRIQLAEYEKQKSRDTNAEPAHPQNSDEVADRSQEVESSSSSSMIELVHDGPGSSPPGNTNPLSFPSRSSTHTTKNTMVASPGEEDRREGESLSAAQYVEELG